MQDRKGDGVEERETTKASRESVETTDLAVMFFSPRPR